MDRKKWPIAGAMLLLVLLTFGRSLTQGFAALDDDLLITHNLAVRGMTLENLKTVFTTFDPELYIPLTFVSYQVDYLIAGLHPWMYHLTNIVLHAGNALLVAWVLLLLTKRKALALFGGFVFAVHPLNTEAVVWLAARKDLLSTFFALLSFVAYLYYRRGSLRAYWLSIPLLLLALLSKVMAAMLPLVFLMTDMLIEQRRWNAKMIIDKIPHLMVSGVLMAVAILGKERVIGNHSSYETALMAAKSTIFYVQKFFVPVRLGVFYPFRGEISLFSSAFFIPVTLMIGLIAVIVWSWKKKPWIAFGLLFFLVTLAPTFINFHKGGEIYFASDRYPYLPSVGLLFLIVMCIARVQARMHFVRSAQASWMATGGALILVLAALANMQTRMWDSPVTMFSRTLEMYPQSIAARVALASIARQQGRYEGAIQLLSEGIAYGDDVQLRMGLGTVYAKIVQIPEATDHFLKAMELDPTNPEPLVALAVLDEYKNFITEAAAKYRKAIDMDPSYVSARNKLGSILLKRGYIEEAEEQFVTALDWNPNADGVLYNLSVIREGQGRRDEAIMLLRKAAELNPDSPAIKERLEILTSA